jgi:fatty acid desaturase
MSTATVAPAVGTTNLETGPARDALPLAALAELKRPSLARFVLAIASDWITMIAAFALARRIDHAAAYVVATWIIGTRQHAIGIMGHEGTHRLGSRTQWINDALTQGFCMWPLLSDMHTYAKFHLGHHRHLNMASDPEMKYRASGAPVWDLPRGRAKFALQLVADLMGLGALETLRTLRHTMPRTLRGAVGPAVLTIVFVATCVWTGQLWILAMWYGALFTGFTAVWRLRCWLEHMGSDDTHRVHVPFWAAWFFAPHGIWLHWEHHHFPGVPIHHLPTARALTLRAAPVISLGDLLRLFEGCKPVRSGMHTRADDGASLLGA